MSFITVTELAFLIDRLFPQRKEVKLCETWSLPIINSFFLIEILGGGFFLGEGVCWLIDWWKRRDMNGILIVWFIFNERVCVLLFDIAWRADRLDKSITLSLYFTLRLLDHQSIRKSNPTQNEIKSHQINFSANLIDKWPVCEEVLLLAVFIINVTSCVKS
jgi:hypothetical protein